MKWDTGSNISWVLITTCFATKPGHLVIQPISHCSMRTNTFVKRFWNTLLLLLCELWSFRMRYIHSRLKLYKWIYVRTYVWMCVPTCAFALWSRFDFVSLVLCACVWLDACTYTAMVACVECISHILDMMASMTHKNVLPHYMWAYTCKHTAIHNTWPQTNTYSYSCPPSKTDASLTLNATRMRLAAPWCQFVISSSATYYACQTDRLYRSNSYSHWLAIIKLNRIHIRANACVHMCCLNSIRVGACWHHWSKWKTYHSLE